MASDIHIPAKQAKKSEAKSEATQLVQKVDKDIHPMKSFLTKFSNDWSMYFSSALAYSLLIALVPIAIALISILGFVLGNSNSQAIVSQAEQSVTFLRSQQVFINQAIHNLEKQAGFLAVLAVLVAIFGGSRLFVTLEVFLDIVYRVRPRTFISQNIMALLMMILFIILVPIMVFAGTLPSFARSFLDSVPFLRQFTILSTIADNVVTAFLAGLLAAFLLFEAIFVVVPNQRISWKHSWLGALVSAIALQLFISVVFPFYANNFMKNYVGQAGLVVVLLVFFYYFAVILMLGAEINAFFSEGVKPLPNDLATFVSTMAGKLNEDRPSEEGEPHINPKPTNLADNAHIARARDTEEQNKQNNTHKQEQVVVANHLQQPAPQAKRPSKLLTGLEVAVGSMLALVIELVRLRQRQK